MRILVTGAAGFIGGALVVALRQRGHDVVGLDNYIYQAHAASEAIEGSEAIERVDVRDQERVCDLLRGMDLVCHQAAMVGAGIAPSDLPDFASHNDLGTASLLAAMADAGATRLLLASSMVVYGDGRYACPDHGAGVAARSLSDLRGGRFDVGCPACGRAMDWQLIDEDEPLTPRSGYAASKVAQEHFSSAWARQVDGSVIALRYHNVYGPGMPANTPYAGVAAIFRSALENGMTPRVYEDGGQMRDFVHLDDVVAANLLAVESLENPVPGRVRAYNICSGRPISIADVANRVVAGMAGPRVEPVITAEFRAGDVRHVVASPDRARRELGFIASITPAQGLARFATDPLRPAGAATTP